MGHGGLTPALRSVLVGFVVAKMWVGCEGSSLVGQGGRLLPGRQGEGAQGGRLWFTIRRKGFLICLTCVPHDALVGPLLSLHSHQLCLEARVREGQPGFADLAVRSTKVCKQLRSTKKPNSAMGIQKGCSTL